MAARRLTFLAALIGAATSVATAPASAQSSPALVAIVDLARTGLVDSARALIKGVLDRTPPTDSGYAEALYTSGLLAATEYDRRLVLRRIIVEYAGSGWADDALLLIGQVEYANGNPSLALAQFNRIISDYPSSALLPTAAFWGARAAADMRDAAVACRLADRGLAVPDVDVELANQLRFQRQRCVALQSQPAPDSAPATPSTRPTPAPPPPPAATPGPARGIFVQAIAAPTQARADEIVAVMKELGYQAVVVNEGGYFKVRAGPFSSRTLATAAQAKIRARLNNQPFIVTVP